MEQLANPLSQQAGKWLVIPEGEGYDSSLRVFHVNNAPHNTIAHCTNTPSSDLICKKICTIEDKPLECPTFQQNRILKE